MRITRRPNPQLKQIVLEETNDGRDVVRFLKSTFMQVEDAPSLFGLSPKEYARTHKIAAARILARLGLEDGKRYLRRNYVQTPFKRVHPEDEDLPKRDMAASTSELYRLVKKETNDGRDIIIRFVGIMKGYYPEYKPHLRMAAAKELIRQIEFDYDDEPARTEPVGVPLVGAHNPQPSTSDESDPNPIPNSELTIDNPDDSPTNQSHPEYSDNPVNPDSDKITAHHTNQANHSSDDRPKLITNPYRAYADLHCASDGESIYRSIVRRASDSPTLGNAKYKAGQLIQDFNRFAKDCDPEHQPVSVPDDLLAKSLTQLRESPETYVFDPDDYYELGLDEFYYCLCRYCEECDELDYYFETMREFEEDADPLYEDP